jgi:hypothetical protein
MLFSDPRKWTKSAVGSWWRFWFMAIAISVMSVYAVFVAADSGFRSGLIVALMPLMFQFFFLYALRRMYRQATGEELAVSAV